MNCDEARVALRTSAEAEAAPDDETSAHVRGCESCLESWSDMRLERTMHANRVPPPRDGFVDDVIAQAIRGATKRRRRRIAVAASIATIAVMSLVFVLVLANRSDSDAPSVTLAAHQGKTVQVIIDSPVAQDAATLAIELGANLRLAGYPNDRRIEWQTSLSEGKNLLALPLLMTGDADSQFDVILLHGSSRNVVHVRVHVAPVGPALPPKA